MPTELQARYRSLRDTLAGFTNTVIGNINKMDSGKYKDTGASPVPDTAIPVGNMLQEAGKIVPWIGDLMKFKEDYVTWEKKHVETS